MCITVCVCVCGDIYVHMYGMYVCVCMHVIYVCVCLHLMYACVCMYVYMCDIVGLCTYIHVAMYECMYVYICYVFMYVYFQCILMVSICI